MTMEDPPYIILNEGGMRPNPPPSPSLSPSPLSLSESSYPQYSSPASSVSITTHDTSRTKYHIRDLGTFAARLEHAAESIFPNKGRSRYKNARVLLLRWEEDPMGVQYELDDLAKAFEDTYGFETETWLIPIVKSHFDLMGKALQVVQDWGKADDLLIVYYAGHGLMNASRQALWSCRENIAYASVQWYAIQTLFEQAESDVLLLLDCCSAASGAPTEGVSSSVTETIAACGFETWAPQPGRHSFTNTLIAVLKEWQHRGAFTASMLHCEVLNRLRHEKPERYRNTDRFECRKSPIHIVSTSDPKARSIELCPRRSDFIAPAVIEPSISAVPRGRGSVPSKLGLCFEEAAECFEKLSPKAMLETDVYSTESIIKVLDDASTVVPHVLISLALEEEQLLDFEQCRRWLQDFPALAKFGKVQGVYRSNSTLILLSVPVAIWNWIPDDPACAFIGYVHSENLFKIARNPEDTQGDAVQQNAASTTRVSVEFSQTGPKEQHQPKTRAWWKFMQHHRSFLMIMLYLIPVITGLALSFYSGSQKRTRDPIKHIKVLSANPGDLSVVDNMYSPAFLKDPGVSQRSSFRGSPLSGSSFSAEGIKINFDRYQFGGADLELNLPQFGGCRHSIHPNSICQRVDSVERKHPLIDVAQESVHSYNTKNWFSSGPHLLTLSPELRGKTQEWVDYTSPWNIPFTSHSDKDLYWNNYDSSGSDFGFLVLTVPVPVVHSLTSYIFTFFWHPKSTTKSYRGLPSIIYWLQQFTILFYCRYSVPYIILSLKERLGGSWTDLEDPLWNMYWNTPFAIDLVYLITTYWYRGNPQRLPQNARPRLRRHRRQGPIRASSRLKKAISFLKALMLPLLIVFLVHQIETLDYFTPPHLSRNPPYAELILLFSGFFLVFERGWIIVGFISFSIWISVKTWTTTTNLILHIWNFEKFLINLCHQGLLWNLNLAISASRSFLGLWRRVPRFLVSLFTACCVAFVGTWRVFVEISTIVLLFLWNSLHKALVHCRLVLTRVIHFRPTMDHVRYLAGVIFCSLSSLKCWLESHMGDVALVVLVFEAIYLPMILFSHHSWENFLDPLGVLLHTYILQEPVSESLILEFMVLQEWVIKYFVTILMKAITLYLTSVAVVDISAFLLSRIDSRSEQSSKTPSADGPNVDAFLKVMSGPDIERVVSLSPLPTSWELLLAIYKAVVSALLICAADYLSARTSLPRPMEAPYLYLYMTLVGMLLVFCTARGASKLFRSHQISGESDRRILEISLEVDRRQQPGLQVVGVLVYSWVSRQILRLSLIFGIFFALYRFDNIDPRDLAMRSLIYLSESLLSFSLISGLGIWIYICIVVFVPEKRVFFLNIICWGISLAMIYITYPNYWSIYQNDATHFRFQIYTVAKSMEWFVMLLVFYLSSTGAADYYRHKKIMSEWMELEEKVRLVRGKSWAGSHDASYSKNWNSLSSGISDLNHSYWHSSRKEKEAYFYSELH